GFLAGLIGTGGAIRGAFLIGFGLEKKVYIATAATIALMVDLTRLPVYFFQGFIQPQIYLIIPFIFATSLLGSYTGKLLITKIPQETFRIIVLMAIFIVGIKFIYDGVLYF
ncbi:MAG: sulfite exporter TauE/SafE family protein, partial [Methanobacteriaceae archaeon]|nr:sulfite exporter TauE/SafE family protein [Methanobacteriaceae archaeon]